MSDQKLKNGESPTQRARPKSAYYENSYYYTVNLTRDENSPFGIQLSPEGQHVDSVRPVRDCTEVDEKMGTKHLIKA